MTLKQLIKLEDKAKEVWVISPNLHYDTENKDFSELISVNLGQKTKYRYIVPGTPQIEKNIKVFKKMYSVSEKEVKEFFLILPNSEWLPFVMECAIYNASTKSIAVGAPANENSQDVIKFNEETTAYMTASFKKIWKKYKRTNP